MPKSSDVLDTIVRTLAEVRALARYLVEVVELQQHEPELRKFDSASRLLDDIVSTVSRHVVLLDRHLAQIGASQDPVRQSTAAMAGAFLGFITKLRSHDTSKILRDDSTLLTLVSVKCQILRTTAFALQHREIGASATKMIAELAPLADECKRLLPEVLVQELKKTFAGVEVADSTSVAPNAPPATVSVLSSAQLAATA